MMMLRLCIPLALLCATMGAWGQARYRVMFYNVENLFDPFEDSLTSDDEFTPAGDRRWTWRRMDDKLSDIHKVITAVGGWEAPTLVGLCEVENRFVLNRLIHQTPLSQVGYRAVHRDSPDRRGIDVALLYRPDQFRVEESRFFRVHLPHNPQGTTREVLYARGVLLGVDTLHVFVNHWPSKLGGALATEPGRVAAAQLVRQKVDSIQIFYPNARIIIMGDLNDGPNSRAIAQALGALPPTPSPRPQALYNLHHRWEGTGSGTIKFQGAWEVIDMIIVSGSLLNRQHGVHTTPEGGSIFRADFLMEEDTQFVGLRPSRTYIGPRYHGGFSDHLPIYMDLLVTP